MTVLRGHPDRVALRGISRAGRHRCHRLGSRRLSDLAHIADRISRHRGDDPSRCDPFEESPGAAGRSGWDQDSAAGRRATDQRRDLLGRAHRVGRADPERRGLRQCDLDSAGHGHRQAAPANSARRADDAAFSRDLIDPAMMSPTRGPLREAAAKAEHAYGGQSCRISNRRLTGCSTARDGWSAACRPCDKPPQSADPAGNPRAAANPALQMAPIPSRPRPSRRLRQPLAVRHLPTLVHRSDQGGKGPSPHREQFENWPVR
jgi:hypothetical protein